MHPANSHACVPCLTCDWNVGLKTATAWVHVTAIACSSRIVEIDVLSSWYAAHGTEQQHAVVVVHKLLPLHVARHHCPAGQAETIFQTAILEQGRGRVLDTLAEIQERNRAVKDLEASLLELHQIFLDMAVLVEAQGEMLDNIEKQVSSSSRLQLSVLGVFGIS